MFMLDKTDLEIAIGNLYGELYKLRKEGKLLEELENIEALIEGFKIDRDFLLEAIKVRYPE